jgi:hypothetical protein
MGTAAAIIPRLAVPTAGFVASAIIPLQAYQNILTEENV